MRRRRPAALDDGQAAVELALALPLVALLLLAGVQLTVVIRAQLAVIHAAREAARAAAVSTTTGDGTAAADGAVRLAPLQVSVTTGGDSVHATVASRVATDVPIVGVLLPDVTVRGEAVMRVEP